MPGTLRIGTRGSALARWQADHVAGLLQAAHADVRVEVVIITTQGDRRLDQPLTQIGGKGVFTLELENALREGAIDFAVHSLKDLPTAPSDQLVIGAIPPRGDPGDALISREGYTLAMLPPGATVGTSSRRRAAQLLHRRPDLHIVDIRGNVDTRLRKAAGDEYDAILLAYAGLERLGRLDAVGERLDYEVMLPAPGQGALAVQCREDGAQRALLAPIHHPLSAAAVSAERAFLAGLGGGCALPIAAYATVDDSLRLRGRVNSLDGKDQIDVSMVGDPADAEQIGRALAQETLARGAGALLEASQ